MTKKQKADEIIRKIRKGNYEDWVQCIGEGLEEYAAMQCQQDKNFITRLKASIDRIYHNSGLKELALNGSRGQYEEVERKFFDAMEEIKLEYLQGMNAASYAGSADIWQPIATAPRDGTTIEISYDSEHTDTCLAMWSQRPVCMGGSTVYNKPGWATPAESECDANLPLDAPLYWRPYAGSAEGEKEHPKELESYNYLPEPNEKGERYPGESDQDLKDAIIIGLEEGSAQWEERARFAEKQVEELKAAVRSFEEKSSYNSMKASVLDPCGHRQGGELQKRDPWISQELAVKILKIRDELVKGDKQEAYHILYSIADPKMEKFKPWAELEKIASEPPAATNQQ